MDLPIEHGDFPSFFVCFPEGKTLGDFPLFNTDRFSSLKDLKTSEDDHETHHFPADCFFLAAMIMKSSRHPQSPVD